MLVSAQICQSKNSGCAKKFNLRKSSVTSVSTVTTVFRPVREGLGRTTQAGLKEPIGPPPDVSIKWVIA